jgi:hypothetical protein
MPDDAALWAYGVTRADVTPPEGVQAIVHEDLAVLVREVPLEEYGEAPLRRNLNDLAWLERVARDHEAVLAEVLERTTVVPLRLATIFADADGGRRMLDERRDVLRQALATLAGRQEWSVKVLADPERLLAAAGGGGEPEPAEAGAGAGAAYLLRRRAERDRRGEAERIAAELAEDIHARLRDWAGAAAVRPAQNRELSGHEGDMLLNGAYLVDAARVPELRELVDALRERHRDSGARIELSGPFPPYTFVAGG